MDKQQIFKSIIATLHEIYDKQLSIEGQKIWWNAFKQYSAEQIATAMQKHIEDPDVGKFAPKPADIIAKITGTQKQKTINTESKAIAAWDEAYAAMIKHGQYRSVKLSDPIGMKVIAHLGGWSTFCMMKVDEEQWRRKEFINTYMTLQGSSELPKMLSGLGQESIEKLEAKQQLENIYQKTEQYHGNN